MSIVYQHLHFYLGYLSLIAGIIIAGLIPLFAKKIRYIFVKNYGKIKPVFGLFILAEIANLLALASAQMAVNLGDPSLVAAVETTMPAFTFLLSIFFISRLHISAQTLWHNFPHKITIVFVMALGVWLVS
jgi:uncharacterized membrane protein